MEDETKHPEPHDNLFQLMRDRWGGLQLDFPVGTPREEREIPAARITRLAGNFGAEVGVPIRIKNAVIKGDLNLSGAAFAHGLAITRCEFEGRVNFSHATFKGGLDLRGSHFKRAADFRAARFEGDCDLTRSAFLRACRFDDARFLGCVTAAGAQFRRASFRRADFGGWLDFTPASAGSPTPVRFERLADFSDAHVAGPARFDGAWFGKGASFRQARFDSSVSFRCYLGIPERDAHATVAGAPAPPWLCVTTFGGLLDFARASVEGLASFEGALFEGPVDFQRAQLNNTTVFSSYEVGEGEGTRLLSRTRFFKEVDFSVCRIGAGAAFLGVEFRGPADFERVSVGGHLLFKPLQTAGEPVGTWFCDGARFLGARVANNAEFDGVVFGGEANFDHFEVERNVYFRPAFNGEEVWRYTTFLGIADFVGARVKGDAEFTGAVFLKDVRLESIHVEGNALFNDEFDFPGQGLKKVLPVFFAGRVNLISAHFKHRTECCGAVFRRGARFESSDFEGAALFEDAKFDGEADFTGSRFGQYVDFHGATFNDAADFKSVQVGGGVFFNDAAFLGATSFKAADFKSLDFTLRDLPAGRQHFGRSLNLSGFTYELIRINPALLDDIFDNLPEYNRQAFTQLERVLRSIGEDDSADRTHLRRRRREREDRWKKLKEDFKAIAPDGWRGRHDDNAITRWFKGMTAVFFDRMQKEIGNYGIRPFTRLLFISLLVLFAGTLMFWREGAVVPKEAGAGASYVVRPGEGGQMEAFPVDAKAGQVLKLDGGGARILVPAEKASEPVKLRFTQAVGVSFNQFIPIVQIPSGSKWKPSEKLIPLPFGKRFYYFSYAFYGTIHALLGAILVPLGVAALTGLLHRREKPGK